MVLALVLGSVLPACSDDAGPTGAEPTTSGSPSTSLPTATTGDAGVTADSVPPWPTPLPDPLLSDPLLSNPLPSDRPHQWTVRIVERLPHDPDAFTQGLEMSERGLIEGTGRRGQSSLRLVEPATGEIVDIAELDERLFGEGLTVVDDEVVQLTWEAGRALRYRLDDFAPLGAFSYAGEGWGICADGAGFWMSDGTATLTRRERSTFAPVDSIVVTREGVAVDDLNELECIGDHVVANIWKSPEIVVIDPVDGRVVATIDATPLVREIGATDAQEVLNGIADLGDGTLLLGGKRWPTFFVVELVEVVEG